MVQSVETGKYCFPCPHLLTYIYPDRGIGRKIDVQSRTKADKTKSFTSVDCVPRGYPADDSARDKTGYLNIGQTVAAVRYH